jgi:hypothetical protein
MEDIELPFFLERRGMVEIGRGGANTEVWQMCMSCQLGRSTARGLL